MKNKKKYCGCCFTCPDISPAHLSDNSSAQRKKPVRLLNAWPEIAVEEDLLTPRTFPYTRTMYYPIMPEAEIPDDLVTGRVPFYMLYSLLHEKIHYDQLIDTPAKNLARALLARSYSIIDSWLFMEPQEGLGVDFSNYHYLGKLGRHLDEQKPREDSVTAFRTLTKLFNLITDRIRFSEELLADALTFTSLLEWCRAGLLWPGSRQQIKDGRIKVLGLQEANFPGFIAGFECFMKIFARFFGERDEFEYLIPLLQSVTFTLGGAIRGKIADLLPTLLVPPEYFSYVPLDSYLYGLPGGFFIFDSSPIISMLVKEGDDELDINLLHTMQKSYIYGSQMVELTAQYKKGSPVEIFFKRLMTPVYLAKSREINKTSASSWLQSVAPHLILTRGTSTINQDIIYPAITLHEESSGFSRDELTSLLFYEGLRQQLVTKKGLICPRDKGDGRCRCPSDRRAGFEYLYRFAKDKLFGNNECPMWKPLACS